MAHKNYMRTVTREVWEIWFDKFKQILDEHLENKTKMVIIHRLQQSSLSSAPTTLPQPRKIKNIAIGNFLCGDLSGICFVLSFETFLWKCFGGVKFAQLSNGLIMYKLTLIEKYVRLIVSVHLGTEKEQYWYQTSQKCYKHQWCNAVAHNSYRLSCMFRLKMFYYRSNFSWIFLITIFRKSVGSDRFRKKSDFLFRRNVFLQIFLLRKQNLLSGCTFN